MNQTFPEPSIAQRLGSWPPVHRVAGRLAARPFVAGETFQVGWSNAVGIVLANIKQISRLMIAQLSKRRFGAERLKRQFVQGVVMLIAGIIFVGGFRNIAVLDLTEAQMFLGFGIGFSLVLQCLILWVLIDLKRKVA